MSDYHDDGLLPERNPWLGLVQDPSRLPYRARVDVVRRLAGRLQANANDRELAWLGSRLTAWLSGPAGGDLTAVLGLRPPPGSRMSAPAIAAQQQRDLALLELSLATDNYRAALDLLESGTLSPEWSCLAKKPPRSEAAFTRALQRVSRPAG